MDYKGFIKWMNDNNIYTSSKIRRDYASRAKKVEHAFAEIRPDFSYESEYEKDECTELIRLISKRGTTINFEINLPLGTNHMNTLASAAKKYVQFLSEK